MGIPWVRRTIASHSSVHDVCALFASCTKGILQRVRDVQEPIRRAVGVVRIPYGPSSRAKRMIRHEKDCVAGRDPETFSHHVAELSHREVDGDEVLFLVDHRFVALPAFHDHGYESVEPVGDALKLGSALVLGQTLAKGQHPVWLYYPSSPVFFRRDLCRSLPVPPFESHGWVPRAHGTGALARPDAADRWANEKQ